MTGSRRDDLERALARVEERIVAACAQAGRDRHEVTLVAVTKFFPASDVRLLLDLGVRHVAESRHQEGVAKRADCPDPELTWHFVGRLQSNKAAAVGGWADVVQSVDRDLLLPALGRAAEARGRRLDVLVQVSLDPPGSRTGPAGERGGVAPLDAPALARSAQATPGLRCRGVMGVAPLEGDAREAFARLAGVRDDVRAEVGTADWMSAGMSGDLELAVAAGATHVRVGSAVLGNRPARR